GYRFMP
ncbi:hypothetical protein GUJ66_021115, partial [Escherichia fergusonii]|nr:hypothetical protein [Escherichia fergusonii]